MHIQCYTWWKNDSNKNKLNDKRGGAYNMRKNKNNDISKEFRMQTAFRIKQARLSRGITQEKMAEILDISTTHYQNIEYGKYNIGYQHLEKISNMFQLTTDYLLFGKVKKEMNFEVFYETLLPEEKIDLFLTMLSKMCKDKTNDYGEILDEFVDRIKEEK